jgi:uracil-DNA glycosylase
VTNVVKHFKWTQGRGKRRLHQRPSAGEVAACRPWLDAELETVRPRVLACLGATAAKALLGSGVSVTVHPSSILRIDDDAERRAARTEFVADLMRIARWLEES